MWASIAYKGFSKIAMALRELFLGQLPSCTRNIGDGGN
jgi:hypothetical protein